MALSGSQKTALGTTGVTARKRSITAKAAAAIIGGLYVRVDSNGYLDFGDQMIGIYLGEQP